MKRVPIVAVLIAVAVLGGAYGWQHQDAVPSGPPDQPRTFTGTGMSKTASFHLRGGSYRVQWEASPTSAPVPGADPSCFHAILLDHANGGSVAQQLAVLTVRTPGQQGESAAHVPAGDYALTLQSNCTWRVTVSPQ
jgi:hypothetical protein